MAFGQMPYGQICLNQAKDGSKEVIYESSNPMYTQAQDLATSHRDA
jgi:hypothetical protein